MPPRLVLPYHRYLGPGNELESGEPVDSDDYIAEKHDYAYANAISAQDVLRADEEAVKEFWSDFSTTGNWHSLIGAAGLKLKSIVKKNTGVLYPDMSNKHEEKYKKLPVRLGLTRRRGDNENRQNEARNKELLSRRDPTQDPAQPSSSRDVSDIGQDEGYGTQMSQGNAPMNTDEVDAGEEMGNPSNTEGVTNPTNGSGVLYMMKSLASPTFTFFKKSRIMHTWGFASHRFNLGPKGKESNYMGLSTSLAYVPVDWIPFYLSPAEYSMLPLGSFIKEVYVEIIPKGVRCSFDTGTTLTGSANSMHVIFGKHCVGLNHKVEHVNYILKNDEKKPMTINSLANITSSEFTYRLYGETANYHSNKDPVFPSSRGANRALPAYAVLMCTGNGSTNSYYIKTGWPCLDKIVERYNLNEHINTPCVRYTYKPRNGILKHLYNSSVVPNKVKLLSGRLDIGVKETQFLVDTNFQNTHMSFAPCREKDKQKFGYENIIEKNFMTGHPNNKSHTISQPQVHIGIEPVQSNAPADANQNWVNASAEYEIRASCVIGIRTDLMYADGMYANKLGFPSATKQANHNYFISQNHVGGHYCENWQGHYNNSD